MRPPDLVGKTFGRLTVVYRTVNSNGGKAQWVCVCKCNSLTSQVTVVTNDLLKGHTKSCGCLRIEKIVGLNTTHGLKYHSLYGIWCHMKDRCLNPKDSRYKDWGGRGITIYAEWIDDAEKFIEWAVTSGWKPGLQIDRQNNNGDYEPSNCRWVSSKIQQRNRRDNVVIEFNGETHVLSEWAEVKGIGASTLGFRIRSGWTIEDALTTPVRPIKKCTAEIDRLQRAKEPK